MTHKIININNETDWHKERFKGLGGSDVASILGMNPFKTNVELWKEKTGRTQPEDISEKPQVKYGKLAEEHLRNLFILDFPEYEVKHNAFNIHIKNGFDYIRGSLDGELLHKTTKEKGILEIKTTEIKRAQDWKKWDNKIPQNYYIQVLHYFLIDEEYKFCKLKAQIKSISRSNELLETTKHYTILREKCLADIDYLFNKEQEFWHYVEADKEPPLLLPSI
jgi:putative phage-type endonuclease